MDLQFDYGPFTKEVLNRVITKSNSCEPNTNNTQPIWLHEIVKLLTNSVERTHSHMDFFHCIIAIHLN
jgi:hypothetical protein